MHFCSLSQKAQSFIHSLDPQGQILTPLRICEEWKDAALGMDGTILKQYQNKGTLFFQADGQLRALLL